MTTLRVRGGAELSGYVVVPGDKSISHRALMLGAVAKGKSMIRNLAPGDDVASTVSTLRAYGVRLTTDDTAVTVEGRGLGAWKQPTAPLDCGNSGSTMRMLAGFAAHNAFPSTFDGDESLRARPMERIAGPLRALGARVETTDGRPPVVVEGGRLSGAEIEIDVASAQVKSCALFAALGADGHTVVIEPTRSRDHAERLLAAIGAPITESTEEDGRHRMDVMYHVPRPFRINVPGDVSSASFLVAAAVLSGSVRIEDVGLNPTRLGFLETLASMGASVRWEAEFEEMREPVGVIEADREQLKAITLPEAGPSVADELPLLAVIATQAEGETVIRGAGELRLKETDRISATVSGLRAMGADIDELEDGFVVRGPTPLRGAVVASQGDHRIAMALAVAGLAAEGETAIEGFECAGVSYPGFETTLATLGAQMELA